MNSVDREPVFIIIPVHNRKNITLKCLENLSQQGSLQRYHVVVVDDGSTDGTTEAIHYLYPEVTVLAGDGNLWWTGAIKKGMEYACDRGAQHLIWLNDDCLVTDKALQDLISFSQKDSQYIVGCQGFDFNNQNIITFGGKYRTWQGYKIANFPKNTVSKCDLLSGNLVCLPRSVVEQIGYPDPTILPHYGGDALFLIRARNAGFQVFIDTRNLVFDLWGEPKLAPNRWLLKDGEALAIIKLALIRESMLNWRVWFYLDLEDYRFLGILMFLYKYTLLVISPLTIITVLRFLPISIRYQLSSLKEKMQFLSI